MVSTRLCQLKFSVIWLVLVVTSFMTNAEPAMTHTSTQKSHSQKECVIVLHGLARTANAMKKLASALEPDYKVINNTYPSRKHTIEKLAELAIAPALEQCKSAAKVHMVTHSLGGILVRQYLSVNTVKNLGNVVMLGPPNQGSEIVDHFLASPFMSRIFNLANGPAGKQLNTQGSGKPKTLGAVNFSLGVIAGNKSYNPILSSFLPSDSDGKVTVQSSKVDGMVDHLTLPVDHTFMMRNNEVITQVKQFLANARFDHQPK